MTEKITSFFPQSRSAKNVKKDKLLAKGPLLIKKVLTNAKTCPITLKESQVLEENIENIEPIENLKHSKAASPLLVEPETLPVGSKKRKWEIAQDIHTSNSIKTVGMISNTTLVNGAITKKRVDLPLQYQRLEKMFSALESTITFMKSRDQAIVFHRIQRAVQGMCNANFELKHLGQMIHLVPGLYVLEPIKIIHLGVKKDSIVFLTYSKIENQENQGSKVVFGGTLDNIPKFEKNENVMKQAELVTQTLYERKKTFHDAIVRDVLFFYNKYLVSVGKPKVDMLPFKWQKGFDENSLPEIESAELPIPCVHAQIKEEPPKAVTMDKSQPKLSVSATEVSQSTSITDKPKSKAAQLLERIKEKERKKKEKATTIPDTAVLREKSMLQRMPEMIQSIKLLYAKENRSMLLMFKVCNHLSNSMIKNPISKDEALCHIKLLCNIAPNFISICKTDSGTSLKMNNVKYEEVDNALKDYGKKLC